MINNYDKMQKMESVLTSVLPEGISWQNSLSAVENSQKKGGSLQNSQMGRMSGTETGGDNLLVEHASGGVNPTPAHETMSETYPETAGQSQNETEVETEEQNRVSGDDQTETENQTGTDQPSSHGSAGTKTAPSQTAAESDRAAISAALASGTYQIQPGETLYGICLKLYGNGSRLEEICRLNGLEDENKIMAGQNLILPQ